MTAVKIEPAVIEAFGGQRQFDAALAAFREALEFHATTVNVPAPTAHPYIEQVVRDFAGEYEVVEPEPLPEPEVTPFEPIPVPEASEPDWSLSQRREWKLAELALFRWQKQRLGVPYAGIQFPADRDTIGDLFVNRQVMVPGTSIQWKANGKSISLTTAQIDELLPLLQAHVQACYGREAKVIPQIWMIEDKAAMKAFDVAAHWPSKE